MASCPHSMDESADCFCPATMLLRLQSCLTARKHLQERISSLEYNLNHKKSLLEKHKFDARTYDDALKKCIEDRAALEAKCASLENELMILTMPWEELAKTDVSMSTEQLKNSNKEKEMIASAGIQLDNLMENTRKLAVDFASFKNRVRKHGYQSEELKKSSNSL
ncbi:uncharacterized protein LOC103700031 isoform X2 [Phoenix dactylifera]|uniref:Uncharacterized protein LOC103700031 isoform X2 n=1 Tax=Phoenix dactylifera TaxID=42345 RepID=A0A8B9AJL5_PHODC|nr:uncharacterized protein LOC103700031 isoform X2 [Phoenix dactylifera]